MNDIVRSWLGILPLTAAFLPSLNATPFVMERADTVHLLSGGTVVTSLVPGDGIDIVINAGATLAANTPALAAFERAAQQWESVLRDSITITIDADLGSLGSSVIGSASSVILSTSYTSVRNAMVDDEAAESQVHSIVGNLPRAGQIGFLLPVGFSTTGDVSGTKANLKALGFTGLDATFGATDATITFNSGFTFDYDNSDGVSPGAVDFETVAAHEIGHALGFSSRVDQVDEALDEGTTTSVSPSTFDLFRFQSGTANDPETAGEFNVFDRSLLPGDAAIMDLITSEEGSPIEVSLSTGTFTGDGRQASHWKDGLSLGLMDPTLAVGEIVQVAENDIWALDVIGYDAEHIYVPVPEPSGFALLSVGATLGWGLRRRRS